jgi:hypothetical protein
MSGANILPKELAVNVYLDVQSMLFQRMGMTKKFAVYIYKRLKMKLDQML